MVLLNPGATDEGELNSFCIHDEMQTSATVGPGEEPPSMLWGLDPVFSAFARLYIRDILHMTESIQVPGNVSQFQKLTIQST